MASPLLPQRSDKFVRILHLEKHRGTVCLWGQQNQTLGIGPIHANGLAARHAKPAGVVMHDGESVGARSRPPFEVAREIDYPNVADIHSGGRHRDRVEAVVDGDRIGSERVSGRTGRI